MDFVSPAATKKIAKDLMMMLLGELGETIKREALDKVFGQEPESFFTQVCEEINKIVEQKLVLHNIKKINSEIKGLATWIKTIYISRKESKASKDELCQLLLPQVNNLAIKVLPLLKDKDYAESALGVFIIGASLHLCLLQELASIDPNAADPYQSSYVTCIRDLAIQYSDYTENTFGELITARQSCITPISSMTIPWPPRGLKILVWEDQLACEKFAIKQEADSVQQDQAVEARQAKYVARVITELTTSTNNPPLATTIWRSLLDCPLPKRDNVTGTQREVLQRHLDEINSDEKEDLFLLEHLSGNSTDVQSSLMTWVYFKLVGLFGKQQSTDTAEQETTPFGALAAAQSPSKHDAMLVKTCQFRPGGIKASLSSGTDQTELIDLSKYGAAGTLHMDLGSLSDKVDPEVIKNVLKSVAKATGTPYKPRKKL